MAANAKNANRTQRKAHKEIREDQENRRARTSDSTELGILRRLIFVQRLTSLVLNSICVSFVLRPSLRFDSECTSLCTIQMWKTNGLGLQCTLQLEPIALA